MVSGVKVQPLLPDELQDRHFHSTFRLHTAADFSRVFSARGKLRGRYFDLHYLVRESRLPESENSGSRLGLVMAKKLARRAVQRNLLKRLARESFRHVRNRLPPGDLVLRLARPAEAFRACDAEKRAELRRLWRADIDQLLERFMQRSLAAATTLSAASVASVASVASAESVGTARTAGATCPAEPFAPVTSVSPVSPVTPVAPASS